MLFFSSCQKDEFLKEKENTVLTQQETSLRSSPECEICPELIVNGDFSEHCVQEQEHFLDINCVDGPWFNAFGTPDIQFEEDNILEALCYRATFFYNSGVPNVTGESVFYEKDFVADVDYCLDFDFKFLEGTGSSDDYQLCIYLSNALTHNDAPTAADFNHPSNYTDPTLLNQSQQIECFQLSDYLVDDWLHFEVSIEDLTQNFSQLWPVIIPIDGLDLSPGGDSNFGNRAYFDNFSMHCKSEQLIGIGSTKAGCTYTFWADERPDSDIAIESWAWDFGDGQTDMGDDITHTYTEAGTYTVTLYIVDENECCHIEEIEVNCEIIDADYCKYICHEDYIGHIKCAQGFVFRDNLTGLPTEQSFINGSYWQTDFDGIAQEIQSYFNSIGADMIVTPTHPTGEILCYKTICLGCPYTGNDGIEVIPSWSTDFFVVDADGVPTGQIVPNYTQVLGTIQSHPQWNGAEWVVIEATITIIINVYFDATTVVVTQNPEGGYLIEYGYTDGIFAIGDHELLTIRGSDTWDGSNCDGSNPTNASVPLFDSCAQ